MTEEEYLQQLADEIAAEMERKELMYQEMAEEHQREEEEGYWTDMNAINAMDFDRQEAIIRKYLKYMNEEDGQQMLRSYKSIERMFSLQKNRSYAVENEIAEQFKNGSMDLILKIAIVFYFCRNQCSGYLYNIIEEYFPEYVNYELCMLPPYN